MPGFLLHKGAYVQCSHGGTATPDTFNPRVKVMGQPIVLQSTPYTVTGCPFKTGGSEQPCLTAAWTSAATRIKSNGSPVLLEDSQAPTAPNATLLRVVTVQQRVRGG